MMLINLQILPWQPFKDGPCSIMMLINLQILPWQPFKDGPLQYHDAD